MNIAIEQDATIASAVHQILDGIPKGVKLAQVTIQFPKNWCWLDSEKKGMYNLHWLEMSLSQWFKLGKFDYQTESLTLSLV